MNVICHNEPFGGDLVVLEIVTLPSLNEMMELMVAMLVDSGILSANLILEKRIRKVNALS
jgi:hypothetical protein